MTRPENAGPEDDRPTVPGLAPVPPDPDPLGIPGLHYMPRPDPVPPAGGEHRRERTRPWGWLSAAAALAALAALAVAWIIGVTTDSPRRTPAVPSPDALAPALPSTPIDASTGYLSPATSSPSATSTVSPAPPSSAAASLSPTPSPSPRLVRVPGVVGERRGSAEATLRAAGFATSVQLVPAPSSRQIRRVLSQQPAAGELARAGATVTLVVGASERTAGDGQT